MQFIIVLLVAMLTRSLAYSPLRAAGAYRLASARNMGKFVDGVEFDTIAREWRMKWSGDADKASLAAAQKVFDGVVKDVKAIDGVKSVQRIVCGGCLDYKIIVALSADKWGAWEQKQFTPEAMFLDAVKAIPGVTAVETQTYTIMPM